MRRTALARWRLRDVGLVRTAESLGFVIKAQNCIAVNGELVVSLLSPEVCTITSIPVWCQTFASLLGLWIIIGDASSTLQPCWLEVPYGLPENTAKIYSEHRHPTSLQKNP